ncbi:MAG: hypothetical protein IT529_12590 [Burkholderiales bacterium]|nr:hypothetical protein [Burkholderiales bacterium]
MVRLLLTACIAAFAAGCAVKPPRAPSADFSGFEPYAADTRVRHEHGAQAQAARVAELLPGAIAQVEAGHYLPFAGPVTVHVCATPACFAERLPGAGRFTAAVIYDNQLLLAPRLFEREPHRLYPILVHELSHLHLGQRLGHYTMRIPVWFHEGLASLVAASGGADLVSEDEALRSISAGEYFMPDASHDETRRKYADYWRIGIGMFYRQSMMLLASLRRQSEEGFRALLESLQRDVPFDEAFANSFGSGAMEFAQHFMDAIRCKARDCSAPAAAP